MRVLHVHSGNLYGGVETLMVTLARERIRSIEHAFALCFEARLSGELKAAGAEVHLLGPVRVRQPLSIRRARRSLAEVIAGGGFDLAICHMPWAQAIFGPAVTAAHIPLVFWMHNEAGGTHWIERWARMTRPDLAICNSRFTEATLARLYPAAPSRVIYCPVADPGNSGTDLEKIALRAELETPAAATVIVQTSRMEPWKGQRLHLEALGKLRELDGWHCWMAGGAQRSKERQYLASLEATAERLGIGSRVHFLGHRSDVSRLLAAADIHCQPNLGPEPFGITFIEAMYAGLPVVTTALGGAVEVVDESCGVLVKPGDSGELAAGLARLIADAGERSRLGAAGAARAAILCDPATQIKRIVDALSGLRICAQAGATYA